MRKRLTYRPYWKKQELTGRYASSLSVKQPVEEFFWGALMGGWGRGREQEKAQQPCSPTSFQGRKRPWHVVQHFPPPNPCGVLVNAAPDRISAFSRLPHGLLRLLHGYFRQMRDARLHRRTNAATE